MYFSIPVELCEYVIRNNFYRPMQLYIYLKSRCSGKIQLTKEELCNAGEAIGLTSERGVKNNLRQLVKKNWVGYSSRSGYYFVRGFDKIREMYHLPSRTSAEFKVEDIRQFKGFAVAAKIGYLINRQKRKRRATELKKGSSNHIARQSLSYYPVANKALGNVLGISLSTAYQLKQMAVVAGYIDIRKTWTKTHLTEHHAGPIKKGLPEIAHRVRVRNNQVFLQGADMVFCKLVFTRRKKLETYIKGGTGGNQRASNVCKAAIAYPGRKK